MPQQESFIKEGRRVVGFSTFPTLQEYKAAPNNSLIVVYDENTNVNGEGLREITDIFYKRNEPVPTPMPDFANISAINRISQNYGEWIAYANGWVLVHMQNNDINPRGGPDALYDFSIFRNGELVYHADDLPVCASVLRVLEYDVIKIGSKTDVATYECFFIPEAAGGGWQDFLGDPDSDRIEGVNLISANGGTWTADRNGYIWYHIDIRSMAGYIHHTETVTVNGVPVFTYTNSAPGGFIPVCMGDVICFSFDVESLLMYEFKCYFTPAKS